ncbi:MAG: hypothetical protein AAF593_13970 [Planctomycetota bacterium]
MTCCPNPAVRWCLLLAVAWSTLSLIGPGGAQVSAEEAATSEPALVDTAVSADAAATTEETAAEPTPAPTVTGLPEDLNSLSREELIDLVRDLTLQNQILAVKLAEQRQALADAAPDLQDRIDWQSRTIERLQAKLVRAERAAEQAAADAAQAAEAVATKDAEADATSTTTADGDGEKWEYRFAYEYGLIRTSRDGYVVVRDKNGKRQRHEFDYTEYRRDAVWVNLLIRNDSEQPMRFTGVIELLGEKPFLSDKRERLATHAFRTPLLQPGEVFQINEDELKVDRPWKLDIIELTNVKAFSTPADPDPDPGKS